METLVQIRQIHPATTREYTKQDGTPGRFHSRGFVLGNGVDEFYCEVTGEQALIEPGQLSMGEWRMAHIKCSVRTFTGQTDGQVRHTVNLELRGLGGTPYNR